MSHPNWQNIKTLSPLYMEVYRRYLPSAYDSGLSIYETLTNTLEYLHQQGLLFGKVLEEWDKMREWILNDGLDEAVRKRLDEWMEDGTLAEIINEQVFGNIQKRLGNYVYISDYDKFGIETDDTGRFQRAIDDALNKKKSLLLNEHIDLSNEVKITNQLTVEGTSWRNTQIRLNHKDARIKITSPEGQSHVYEVELNNVEIKGNDIAEYGIQLINGSQCKFNNVYVDSCVKTNVQIKNSSINYFNFLYSYYSPVAVSFDTTNNINFSNCNFWENDVIFQACNNALDTVVTDCWHERFKKVVELQACAVNVNFQMFSKGCQYLDNDNQAVFCSAMSSENDKSFMMVIDQARINMPLTTKDSLFEFATKENNGLIKVSITNSSMFLNSNVKNIVNTNAVNNRIHMFVKFSDNRSGNVEPISDSAKGIVHGLINDYEGQQAFYSSFVLPQKLSGTIANLKLGSVYYDTTNNTMMLKNNTGAFKAVQLIESGTTTQRPTDGLITGRMFFDTTLGKPLFYNGGWKDATGANA